MKLRQLGGCPLPRDLEKMMQIHDGKLPRQRVMNMFRDEQTPGWAMGLRSLYRAVADEPIPSDFGDLLARLESRSARGSSH